MKYLLLLALVVSGCGINPPKPQTVTQYVIKPLDISDALLQPCPVTEPPSSADYATLLFTEKEDRLSTYVVTLLEDLKVCNNQIAKIKQVRDIQIQQSKEPEHVTKP